MKRIFYILVLAFCLWGESFAQISGNVYRDLNLNGLYQPNTPFFEPGVSNVIVNAYDATNTIIATTTTAANGSYSLPFTVPVRLEFEMPAATQCIDSTVDFSTLVGDGENIRFINASTANVNWGIQNPQDYIVTADPYMFISKFNRGDPLVPGVAASQIAFMSHLYSTNGSSVASPFTTTMDKIGSVWGVAYSKQAKRVFAASFLKRHAGLGPMGSGGIYMMEPFGATFNVTNFYDMDANGHRTRAGAGAPAFGNGSSFTINAAGTIATYLGPIDPLSGQPIGLGVIGTNGVGGRGLDANPNGQWYDPACMDQVGKVGLGDIDISEDGKFLFVTNLYSKMLFRLELDNAYNPQNVIQVDSFALPPISANNGMLRCFAVAYHRGKVYLGAVSTGEFGGQNIIGGATDLYAYVFEVTNPLLGSAALNPTPIISFPLNYIKGGAIGSANGSDRWYPWNNDTDALLPTGEETLPTPMLSDIEFSDRGDLIMDFCDRSGHQFGISTLQHLAVSNDFSAFDIGGDILIAGIDCATGQYTLENNGSFTSNGTVFNGGVGNGEGIGGGEFFKEDQWFAFHNETSVGSCAVLRGRNEVLVSLMDPINAFSNGTGKFNTQNAAVSGSAELANTLEFGKGNSLGDIEVAGDVVELQIGNRVWKDDNNNGIQDPGEQGINNVSIDLFADFNQDNMPDGGTLSTTVSAGDGNWYFDKTNVPDGDPSTPGNQAGPLFGKTYLIRINPADWNGGFGINDLNTLVLTQANFGGPGQPDVRDNDALALNNIPTIVASTKRSGEHLHWFDFGFVPCGAINMTDVTINCANDSTLIGPTPVPGYTYQWQPPSGLSNPTIAQPLASPTTTTTYTLTVNGLCSEPVTVTADFSSPNANAGPNKILDCEQTSVQIGAPPVAGYTYQWTPSSSLDDSTSSQPIANPIKTTTYTLTVVAPNGCKSIAQTTVNIDKCCSRVSMPNSFTPNRDGRNDKFGPAIFENVESFTMTVYNRWGQRIFETDDVNFKWDGTYNGQECMVGVYFYLLTYNCQNFSEPKVLKGDVTLMR
jgi:gliding motility-associated-like protein